MNYSSGAAAGAAAIAGAFGDGGAGGPESYGNGGEPEEAGGFVAVEQRRVDEHDQIGRNDPCWCGSGKKFKKCHGA